MGLFHSQTYIHLDEILAPTDTTVQKVMDCLHENQYLLIELDEETKSELNELRKNGIEFFKQKNDYKESFKYDTKVRQNRGYVEIKDVREYIKFNGQDSEKAPLEFTNLIHFQKKTNSILFKIFEILASHEKDLFLKELPEAIRGFKDEKSSFSLIHYMKPLVNQPTVVSEPHEDTGILTSVFLSNIQGLQVWNKKEEKYFEIEKNVKQDTMVVMIGKKLSLFCKEQGFLEETLHQVVLEGDSERYSIISMLDVQ